MTTTDAVAAWQSSKSPTHRTHVFAVIIACCTAGLAGCGTSSLLGSSDPSPQVATAPTQQSAPVSQSRIAIAPLVGAPDAVGKQVAGQLGPTLERQRVALAKSGERADYTLRGYMVAAKEKAGVKVSYIWDLTDPTGKRVNRIQGDEIAPGGNTGDPWAAITPAVTQTISDKTATALSAALASLTPSSSNASAPVGVGGPATAPTQTASLQTPPDAAPTGSIDRGGAAAGAIAAIVPTVTGAPGDGNAALSGAMRQELQQAGIGPAQSGQRGYTVAGKVTIGPAKDGKQPIKIDWRVVDPNGEQLAVVSQNNDIPANSLDKEWGAVAGEAAQGAAVKIKTLIEENRASSGTAGRTKSATRSKS